MGLFSSIIGGITGKNQAKAAEKAAKLQADAMREAGQLSQAQYEQTRQDNMPWLDAGKGALGQLGEFVGQNNQFEDKWGGRIEDAYQNGQLTGGLDPNNFAQDPSYQFRKQQGEQSVQSLAAAQGNILSGSALKALNEYGGNMASQEFGNAWQRDQAQKQGLFGVLGGNRAQDYNQFSNEQARQYNQFAGLAGVGQQTAGQLGAFGAANATNQGNALIGAGQAQGAGLIGSANAQSNGLQNIINLGAGALKNFVI